MVSTYPHHHTKLGTLEPHMATSWPNHPNVLEDINCWCRNEVFVEKPTVKTIFRARGPVLIGTRSAIGLCESEKVDQNVYWAVSYHSSCGPKT